MRQGAEAVPRFRLVIGLPLPRERGEGQLGQDVSGAALLPAGPLLHGLPVPPTVCAGGRPERSTG